MIKHELYKQDMFQVQQQSFQEVSGKQQHSLMLFRADLYVTFGEALRMIILRANNEVDQHVVTSIVTNPP